MFNYILPNSFNLFDKFSDSLWLSSNLFISSVFRFSKNKILDSKFSILLIAAIINYFLKNP